MLAVQLIMNNSMTTYTGMVNATRLTRGTRQAEVKEGGLNRSTFLLASCKISCKLIEVP
jgi:hypothetical protein